MLGALDVAEASSTAQSQLQNGHLLSLVEIGRPVLTDSCRCRGTAPSAKPVADEAAPRRDGRRAGSAALPRMSFAGSSGERPRPVSTAETVLERREHEDEQAKTGRRAPARRCPPPHESVRTEDAFDPAVGPTRDRRARPCRAPAAAKYEPP